MRSHLFVSKVISKAVPNSVSKTVSKSHSIVLSSLSLLALFASGCGGSTVTLVLGTPPTLVLSQSRLYPLESSSPPGIQGSEIILQATATGEGVVQLGCVYETVGLPETDPNYVASDAETDCSSLKTLASINGTKIVTSGVFASTSADAQATGMITWTPTPTQRGTYKFIISAVDGSKRETSDVVFVTVMDPFTTSNLIALHDAHFSDLGENSILASSPSQPRLLGTGADPFLSLAGTLSGDLSSFTSSPAFGGEGLHSSPYSLSFNGTADQMKLTTVLETHSSFGMQAWVKPGAPSVAGAVIVSNGGGNGNGFVLRQSTTPAGRAEFSVGQKYYSYKDLVLSDKPVGY